MMTSVSVGGVRIRVSGTGDASAERPTLLLLSGLGAPLELWGPLRARLAADTIAFDPPGIGGSPMRWRPPTVASLARLTERLLDALGHRRVDVLGVSWGGVLAQQLAHQAPARVRRLVLAATSFGLGALPGRPAALLAMLHPSRYSRGYAWQLAALSTWTSLPWLRSIPHETLVLAGERDDVVPLTNARVLARLIPHASLRVLPGAGHRFLLDQPAVAAPLIDAFVASPEREPEPEREP